MEHYDDDVIVMTSYTIVEQSSLAIAAIVVSVLLCAATLALFCEHVIFVQRKFRKEGRKAKTTIVLALYPVRYVTHLLRNPANHYLVVYFFCSYSEHVIFYV